MDAVEDEPRKARQLLDSAPHDPFCESYIFTSRDYVYPCNCWKAIL